MNVFTNYTLKTSISTALNSYTFGNLVGFGIMCDFNTSYYVIDWIGNNIFLLNDNCGYATNKEFSLPAFMITVDTNLYITGSHNIWKTDKYLNVLHTYNRYAAGFRGIYFNLTEKHLCSS
jgi:hypothetical protein